MDIYDQLGQRIAAAAREAASQDAKDDQAVLFLEHGIAQLKANQPRGTLRGPDQALGRLRSIIYQQGPHGTGVLDEASAVAALNALAERWSPTATALKDRIDQAFGPDTRR